MGVTEDGGQTASCHTQEGFCRWKEEVEVSKKHRCAAGVIGQGGVDKAAVRERR